MRFNNLRKVRQWGQVLLAMPRMVKEWQESPELGFLHAESWFGRKTIMVQCWRSMDALLDCAKARRAVHLPACLAGWRSTKLSVPTGRWDSGMRPMRSGPDNTNTFMSICPLLSMGGRGGCSLPPERGNRLLGGCRMSPLCLMLSRSLGRRRTCFKNGVSSS